MTEIKYYNRRYLLCNNCGRKGHDYKDCLEPIISLGIINFKIDDMEFNEDELIKSKFHGVYDNLQIVSKQLEEKFIYYNHNRIDNSQVSIDGNDIISNINPSVLERFYYYKERIQFLLVSRKFSLGFIEFIRGRYEIDDPNEIIELFRQMTPHEIELIGEKKNYDELLYALMKKGDETMMDCLNRVYENDKYSNEYLCAKNKFNHILKRSFDHECSISLLTKIKPYWSNPEWGFPKGRRNKRDETNISCAHREFEEETGYKPTDYVLLNNIYPIEEKLTGTNGVNYKHIYYISLDTKKDDNMNDVDNFEIGETRWMRFDEAISTIRSHHVNKKKVLTQVYSFIIKFLINQVDINQKI